MLESMDAFFWSIGGGIGAIMLVIVAYNKLVTMFKVDDLTSTASTVQSGLFDDLSKEISRVKTELHEMKEEYRKEIDEIKKLHKQEKLQWAKQIHDLEMKFEFMKRKNESMRNEALEAYTYIRTNEDIYGSVYATELKERLMRIIVQDSDHRESVENAS